MRALRSSTRCLVSLWLSTEASLEFDVAIGALAGQAVGDLKRWVDTPRRDSVEERGHNRLPARSLAPRDRSVR